MIIKAVKKPVPQEFIQVTEDNVYGYLCFIGEKPDTSTDIGLEMYERYCDLCSKQGGVTVKTLEGELFCAFGNYTTKAYDKKNGEHFYPVDKDYFNENYEIVK